MMSPASSYEAMMSPGSISLAASDDVALASSVASAPPAMRSLAAAVPSQPQPGSGLKRFYEKWPDCRPPEADIPFSQPEPSSMQVPPAGATMGIDQGFSMMPAIMQVPLAGATMGTDQARDDPAVAPANMQVPLEGATVASAQAPSYVPNMHGPPADATVSTAQASTPAAGYQAEPNNQFPEVQATSVDASPSAVAPLSG